MLGPSTAEAFTDRPSAFRSLATPPGRYRGSDGSLKRGIYWYGHSCP